jgi:hypothetical protein
MRHALTLALGLLATSAAAQSDYAVIGEPDLYLGATTIKLQPTDAPNAIAEVFFHNAEVNDGGDESTHVLTMGDLSVEVSFGFNVSPGGADSISVVTPPGYIAIPATLILMEGASGAVLIYHDNMM